MWPHERGQTLLGLYAKQAECAVWTQAELAELGYTLRTKIVESQRRLMKNVALLNCLWHRQRMFLLWKESGADPKRLQKILLRPLPKRVAQ
jgi:hypothetical protein